LCVKQKEQILGMGKGSDDDLCCCKLTYTMDTFKKRIALIGATGSIGTQTLEVLQWYPNTFCIDALAAGKNTTLLAQQVTTITQWQGYPPAVVCLQDDAARQAFITQCPQYTGAVLTGEAGLNQIMQWPTIDTVVMGLVGGIGLPPSLTALQHGKQLLTANKETFVTGGHLIQPYLKQVVPLDSEHSAIFQCLQGQPDNAVQAIWLTASGGPFKNTPVHELPTVTPTEALNHPNWVMGPKVTIDSATLMNKGLEVIEAHWLFGLPPKQLHVVVHAQSILHSGVAFVDGCMLWQAGTPDMRMPLLYGLGYPHRLPMPDAQAHLQPHTPHQWTVTPPDTDKFPCLNLAYQALEAGVPATIALNRADELAVEAFLAGQCRFTDIPQLIEGVLNQLPHFASLPSLEEIEAITQWTNAAFKPLFLSRCNR
jgi:1-deoxy-D-xylulose-5-phosphate reductoisomerase